MLGVEKPGIVGRVSSGGRLKLVKTGSSFVSVFDDRLFLRIRQNATIPPIRARPTKPPTLAAIAPIFLSEVVPDEDPLGEVLEVDVPPVVDGGGPSDLSVLLAMFKIGRAHV